MLYLILLLLEFVTIDYSMKLSREEKYKILLTIADNGYKLDVENIKKLKTNNENKNKLTNLLMLFIPGLNIIITKKNIDKFIKNVEETINNEPVIKKMTNQEKGIYSSNKTNEEKLVYMANISFDNNSKEKPKQLVKKI